METGNANTAPAPVTPTQEDLIRYRILCAMLDNLCREGKLDIQTHDRANAVLAMKTGLKQDSIFI